jgi:hypothetical protein
MISQLRDGRLSAAQALWTDGFEAFCTTEAGALGWIAELEAVRGFPHVARALQAWLEVRLGVQIAPSPTHLNSGAPSYEGEFAAMHGALEALRASLIRGDPRQLGDAEAALRRAGAGLSSEAVDALLARWKRTWRSAGLLAESRPNTVRPTYWDDTADAYLGRRGLYGRRPTTAETADRQGWCDLRRGARLMTVPMVEAAARRFQSRTPARAR